MRLTGFISFNPIFLLSTIVFCLLSGVGCAYHKSSLSDVSALEQFVSGSSDHYSWELVQSESDSNEDRSQLRFKSQEWRGLAWHHNLTILAPKDQLSNVCLLFIGGSGDGSNNIPFVRAVASRARITAAVLSDVPNQPSFEGRKEDALIAYSFKQYLDSGDSTWPALFPMVKSAMRAMDVMQGFFREQGKDSCKAFIVSGASKRGWTTWLTAAVDQRVAGIAPMVFDMLNFKEQIELAKRAYGKESEKIADYSRMGLIERIEEPRTVSLRQWVDPFSYRAVLRMPKLLLLGTNDPYWVADSQRLYIDDLPGVNSIYLKPNGDHHISSDEKLRSVMAEWLRILVLGQEMPQVKWRLDHGPEAAMILHVESSADILRITEWSASSGDRDFRNEKWHHRTVKGQGRNSIQLVLQPPNSGYRAHYLELKLKTGDHSSIHLSTPIRVLPAV